MLRCFSASGVKETSAYAADVNTVVQAALWIDLLNPSREEERVVELALGGEIPTREEMQEIETSSRLYEENGILFMTATVLINADTSTPESTPATFILMPNRLVTLRYADSSPFRNMASLCAGKPQLLMQPAHLMTSLLDAIKTAVETIDNIVSGAGAAITSLPNEGQQTMANSISVAIASDQQVPDPCTFRAKSYAPINSSTAATTQLVAASASNKLYVCALHMITNAANNVALVEDDTSACASPTAGIVGGTTSGTGYILAANGGLTLGSGHGTVAVTAATNRYVCIITSAATQLTGGLSYVLAP